MAPTGAKLVETTEAWNELAPAFQKKFTDDDGVDREFMGQKWKAHTWNGWREQEAVAYEKYKDILEGFDVIGDHSWSKQSYQSKNEKIVGTCHSVAPYQKPPPREFANFLGVSHGHSRNLSKVLKVPVRTCFNPVDIEQFPLETIKTDRILSLNRIMPQKGIHHFLKMIDDLKLKADIAGDDSTLVPDQGYVNQVKQKCAQSAFITYHGLVDDKKRIQLLKDAKILVCFKDAGFEEIFGLVLVEALACGTPVVSINTWGANDIIENGKNGFVCDNPEAMATAVKKIAEGTVKLDPNECRKSAERFSRENCSKTYESLLQSVVKGSRW